MRQKTASVRLAPDFDLNPFGLSNGETVFSVRHILGLDVAKETIVAFVLDEKGAMLRAAITVSNNRSGFGILERWLPDAHKTVAVLEATGPYSRALIGALAQIVRSVHAVNPQLIKRLATSVVETKTDFADAAAIARIGVLLLQTQPHVLERYRTIVDVRHEELSLWLAEYRRLTEMIVALKQQITCVRLHQVPCVDRLIHRRCEQLSELQAHQKRVKLEIEQALMCWRDRDATLLMSIKGVGLLTAASVLVAIRDVSRFPRADSLKAFLGIYPCRRQSGKFEAPSRIARHGNPLVRHMIWNCAKSASRHNDVCRELFNRLIARGKSKPSAYGAVARKLVEIMYGVLRNRRPFENRAGRVRHATVRTTNNGSETCRPDMPSISADAPRGQQKTAGEQIG